MTIHEVLNSIYSTYPPVPGYPSHSFELTFEGIRISLTVARKGQVKSVLLLSTSDSDFSNHESLIESIERFLDHDNEVEIRARMELKRSRKLISDQSIRREINTIAKKCEEMIEGGIKSLAKDCQLTLTALENQLTKELG